MLDENRSGRPQALIDALCDLVLQGPIHEEITETRGPYVCHRAIVEHEGDLWALRWLSSENHSYAAGALKVRARVVPTTVYEPIDE